jgi:hypothetical protein
MVQAGMKPRLRELELTADIGNRRSWQICLTIPISQASSVISPFWIHIIGEEIYGFVLSLRF